MRPTPHGPVPAGSDAQLLAALRAGATPPGADPLPVAALMHRHWRPVHDYVSLFAPPSAFGQSAALVTAAAFAEALDALRDARIPADGRDNAPSGGGAGGGAGPGGGGGGAGAGYDGALRVVFLTAAGRVLRRWAGDERVAALLPGVRRPAEPADDRRLTALAFRSLPAFAQVLLWHREVEAEGLSIPAALLGTDPRAVAERLGEARELLRARCVSAHHELAPDDECRHYGRLLDISLRRTGPLIPDIQRHLAGCAHCRHAADQLRRFDARLPLLLADAVLGEGAGRYVDSRPARRRQRGGADGGRGWRGGDGGRGRGWRGGGGGRRAVRRSRAMGGRLAAWARRAGVRWPGAVREGMRRVGGARAGGGRAGVGRGRWPAGAVAAAGLAAVVVTAALAAALWPAGGLEPSGRRAPGPGISVPGDAGASRMPGTGASVPTGPGAPAGGGASVPGAPGPGGSGATPPAGAGPAGAGALPPTEGALRTRLRPAAAAWLCLDVRGGAPRPGAEVTLTPCSRALTQVWSYDPDGALRNAAAPRLCPDAGRPDGTVALVACAADGAAVRYDLTVRGLIAPRHGATALALAPLGRAAGTPVVVRLRDGGPLERWLTDTPAR
ncbi:RICIN domain-containing protein [Streptomyces sp. enrichment culture]|uniref:RICIN domain-containing protein n=1 Tax=Streptomyces sp. enrichment culture TaxID=1795815 RepID=UPI003F57401F